MKIFIDKMGVNCEGVGKIPEGESKDKLIFVNGAIDGELVDVDIISEKKNYCTGTINGILSLSVNRCEPRCKYFGICGGCDIQHITKDKQHEIKTNVVKQNIKKLSQIDVECRNIIQVNDFAYRNKMVFPINFKDNKLQIGMYEKKSHNIVEIDECLITNDIINNILKLSKKYFDNLDDKQILSQLKYLVVRNYLSEVLVTIVAKSKINLTGYFKHLNNIYGTLGLSLIVGDSQDEIISGKYHHIDGLKYLSIKEFGVEYKLDNRGFLQVNNEIKRLIYESILNEICKGDNVIDAYGGAGLLSAIISKKAKFVISIEINKSASSSAKKLIEENNIKNLKCICGDVKDYIDKYLLDEAVVILDPPRSGCDKSVVLSLLNNTDKIKKIIYLSCDHATLARDLKLLSGKFSISYIQPYDMFPNTKHIETLVVLEKKE